MPHAPPGFSGDAFSQTFNSGAIGAALLQTAIVEASNAEFEYSVALARASKAITAASGATDEFGESAKQAYKRLKDMGEEFVQRNAALSRANVAEGFEESVRGFLTSLGREDFGDAARNFALNLLGSIQEHAAEDLSAMVTDKIFGGLTKSGQRSGGIVDWITEQITGGSGAAFGGLAAQVAAEANASALSVATTTANTIATDANTVALTYLTASMSMMGGASGGAGSAIAGIVSGLFGSGGGAGSSIGGILSAIIGGIGSAGGGAGSSVGSAMAGILPGRAWGGPVEAGEFYETHGLGSREFFRPHIDGDIVLRGQGQHVNNRTSNQKTVNNYFQISLPPAPAGSYVPRRSQRELADSLMSFIQGRFR